MNRRDALKVMGGAVIAPSLVAETTYGLPVMRFLTSRTLSNSEELFKNSEWITSTIQTEKQEVLAWLPQENAMEVLKDKAYAFYGKVSLSRYRYKKDVAWQGPTAIGVRAVDESIFIEVPWNSCVWVNPN